MATFSYGGDTNKFAVEASSESTNFIPVQTSKATINSIGAESTTNANTNGADIKVQTIAFAITSQPSQQPYNAESSVNFTETKQASSTKGLQFKVGESRIKLNKSALYRFKIGGQYFFKKVQPVDGASDVVYLGLVPSDLD